MALLEFFAGAAVAGFVGFYFWLVADERGVSGGFGTGYLGSGHCSREGHSGGLAAGTLLFEAGEAFLFFLFVLADDLQVEQGFGGIRVDAVEHVLEHREALLFVFDERVFLAVTHQADALFDLVD